MKKIVVIIIIIGAAAMFYSMRDKTPEKVVKTPDVVTEKKTVSDFHPDPSNATFNIDDESVKFSGGKNEMSVGPGSAVTEETTILDKFAYGDLNSDGKNDTALLLASFGGGSGTFIYAAAYVSGTVTYKGSDAIFIGDRIAPQSIAISGGVVTVKYLDRGPNEAFAAEPTVAASMQFVFKDGKFQKK